MAVEEAGEELAVHALAAVGAENGLVRAGEVIEGVLGSALEVLALVEAGEDWAGWEAARG